MLEIIREITLDVSEENRFTAITAKQYDSRSRYLLVRLTDRGEALTLPDAASVLISATRPDGLSDGFEGLVQDGAALVPLDYWMLMQDGTVTCELVVTGADGYRLTTMSFSLDVRHSCFGDGPTPGGNHGVYVRLLEEIEELKKKIGEGLGGNGTVTDEQISAAVEKYLTEHPIESPEVEKAAESARKSAEEAEASVGEARTAADEAGESASNAGRCATAAAESASQAASSAEAADSSASAARTAKEGAETAKNEAAQQAINAGNAAQEAATAATGAAEAKTAAQTAQQAAEKAKSGAEQAATNASSSAGTAGESATTARNAAQSAVSAKEAAETAQTAAEAVRDEAGQLAATAESAAQRASTAAENAEKAQTAAESAKSTAAQKATDATNAAQTATSKATEAAEANAAAQTAKGEVQTAATNAGKSATAASESAANAEASEEAAATSESNAAKSATAAAGSAATASNAATAAQAAQGKAETAQAAAESAKSTASQKATEAANAAQTATSKATAASKSATAAGTAKTAAEAAAARAEEAANRLLGVAVVGVIETVNGAPSLVLTGVQDVADYTAYYKVVDEEGNETLVEIGQLVPKDETETKTYTITWVNYDGTVLETDTVTEGTVPTYDGATPTKPADSAYTYTFKGWDKTVVAATADATYTATYAQTAKPVEPTYTNILTSGAYTVNLNKRWSSSSKADTACNGMIYLKVPVADVNGKTIYFKGFPANAKASNQGPLWFGLDSTNTRIATLAKTEAGGGNLWTSEYLVDEGNGVYSIPINATTMSAVNTAGAYLLIDMATVNGSTAVTSLDGFIMTIGEPIA